MASIKLNDPLIGDSARAPIGRAVMRPVQQTPDLSRGLLGALLLALAALIARGFAL